MDKKTEGVEILVKDVLATIPEPYGEDIILEVFQKIEGNAEWRLRYNSLSNDISDDLTDWIINNWIGKYVSSETGMKSLREVPAGEKCSLITSYSKLGHA
jgi:hypothetical protein